MAGWFYCAFHIVKVQGMRLTHLKFHGNFLGLICFILSLLFLTGCSSKPAVYTELIMGTVVEISLWENEEKSELGFNEVRRIDNKFSLYKPDSELLRNELSEEGRYLVSESIRYNKITDGAFDITYRKDKKYDLGGIAKGYAADRVAQIFRENGIKRAMINMGGNLYLLGFPRGKKFWTIGIKDPKEPNKLIGKIRLNKEAGVATSGNYEKPGHIIDPRTGKSVFHVLGVTIVASTAMEADALSTGIFVLGREKGMELVEKMPNVEAVIIDIEGVWVSSGLKDKYESLY